LIEDALFESDFPYWFFDRPLTEPGYYTYVLDGLDCDSVIGLTLDVLVGTNEQTETTLQVWPNPTKGLLYIEADNINKVEIYNLLGQIVLSAEKVETIDVSSLEKGVYFLRVSDENGLKGVTKIIKE
jgi:hypothetical protein